MFISFSHRHIYHKQGTLMRVAFHILCAVFFFALPAIASAATLSLNPSDGSFELGSQFSVGVMVSSPQELMNAASATISFSSELKIVSISPTGSIVDFWAREPSFSNQDGKASFDGVVLDGYQGSAARLTTLVFQGTKLGQAQVSFAAGSVLAHDGLGTSIPSIFDGATFTIVLPEPAAPPVLPSGAPRISSLTHPDQLLWYSNNSPLFIWPLPDDVIDVEAVVSKDSTPVFDAATPGKGLIGRFALERVAEGTHYLHVIFETKKGFSDPATFRFNVDTVPPESFTIQEVYRSNQDDRRPEFLISATDATSGVKHYRVFIDGAHIEDWVDDGSHRYQSPQLFYGSHTLLVKAVDLAGNTTTGELVFVVQYPLLLLFLLLSLFVIVILLIVVVIVLFKHHDLKKAYKSARGIKGVKEDIEELKKKWERMKEEEKVMRSLKKEVTDTEERLAKAKEEIAKHLKEK